MENLELSDQQLMQKILDIKNGNSTVYYSDLRLMIDVYKIKEMDRVFDMVTKAKLKLIYDTEPQKKQTHKESNNHEQVQLFQQYLKDCSQFKRLTREETLELFRRMRRGDKEARDLLISCNLRLVIATVKKINCQNCDMMDLIQEGNIGLMEAIERFDPSRGYKLATYARFWIRMRIDRAIRENTRCIQVPVRILKRIRTIIEAKNKFIKANNRDPSIEELSEMTGLSKIILRRSEVVPEEEISLDKPIANQNNGSIVLGDTLRDKEQTIEEKTEDREEAKKVLTALREIPDRERYVIIHNFGIGTEPVPLARIGRVVGYSRERIRQIRNDALNDLETQLHSCSQDSRAAGM
jgi:RNA polymerase nonessential primary-like sigma factor